MSSDNKLKLLTEWLPLKIDSETLKEDMQRNGGKVVLKGVLQKSDTLNQNGRIYPLSILEREIRNYQKLFVKVEPLENVIIQTLLSLN
jgi:hypothetical protein